MKTVFSNLFSGKWLSSTLVITAMILHLLNLVYAPYLNHDVAEYISMGQMIVNGAVPYKGIVDINPPMIFYISAVPVIISKATHISIPIASLFFFFSLVLFSGYIFIKVLAIDNNASYLEKSLFLTFWIFLSFWTYKTDNFAQREQIVFLFLAGFIVLRKVRHDAKEIPPGLAITCGLLAAIVVSLKPQFLVALLLIDLMFFLSSHNSWNAYLAPEIFVATLFGIAYISHFFLVPGASSYLSYWIPLISRGYSAYNANWEIMFAILFSDPFAFINLGVLILAVALLIKKRLQKQMSLFWAFTCFGLISLLIYFVQFKGWMYQTLGFHYGCLTGLIFLVREYKQSFLKIKNISLVILIGLNLIGLIGGTTTLYSEKTGIKPPFQLPESATAKIINLLVSPDKKVLFLSTEVGSAFPQMTYTERLSAGRFLTAFPIAFFTNHSLQGDVLRGWEKDDKLFFSWLLQDVTRQKPALVFVDIGIKGHTYPYLLKKGFFQYLADYTCIGRADNLIVYLRQNESGDTSSKITSLYQQNLLVQTPSCTGNSSAQSD